MKKLFITLALACATLPVLAQHHGYHGKGLGPYNHNHRHYNGPGIGWWVAPVVVGAIGYELGRQQIVIQQPVVVQNPPSVSGQICTPWTETQNLDGTITRTRTCNQ